MDVNVLPCEWSNAFLKKIFIYLFAQVLVASWGVFVAVCRVFAACGIYFPDQGSNSGPLYWKCRILATGTPGKSLSKCFDAHPLLPWKEGDIY